MTRIIILGSSSGDPSSDRANASLIVDFGASLYQFDAGEGFSSSALRNGINHHRIGTIIVSHTHPDHISGLFLELQMMHLAKRTAPLSVYLPEEAIEAVKRFMVATYLLPERLGFKLTVKPVKPDPVFRDDNITVYARANSHLSHYKDAVESAGHPNRMQSYSYVIRTEDKKIIYSGDIGSLDDYADLLDDCDLLITEGLHLDHDTLFEKAAESGLKRLVLTHLSSAMYGDPEPIRAQAAKFGIEDFRIAADGLVIEFE